VGILIVTRLISQANDMVTAINAFVGRAVAVADHTASRASTDQLMQSDVVVITHAAYVEATKTLTGTHAGKWERLTHWRGGKRLLTIVDEALCNVIEEHQITAEGLGLVLGHIYATPPLCAAFAAELAVLQRLYGALGAQQGISEVMADNGALMAWRDGSASPAGSEPVNLSALRAAMQQLPYDKRNGKADEGERMQIAKRIDATLEAAMSVLDQWAYYVQSGKHPSFNTATFMDAPGPVILDATAGRDYVYTLMGDRVSLIDIPSGVRTYTSVTLHVARARGVGKGTMVEKAKTRFPRLIDDLTKRLTPDRSVFFCVHKAVEHELPEAGELPFAKTMPAHWGAVDGSNDYAGCDVAVIFGLPYRDQATFPTNTVLALHPETRDDDWLAAPSWKGQVNLREHMVRRDVERSVIQAINRICVRRVTDKHGGCPPADVFLALPTGTKGDEMLEAIRSEMPGINVVDWPLEIDDGPKVHRRGSGTPHERLLTFMGNRAPGRTSMTAVARELGLKPDAKKDLQKNLRNENHPTTVALKADGVTYVSTGRGSKSYLVKLA
jgi:hypothetical protein